MTIGSLLVTIQFNTDGSVTGSTYARIAMADTTLKVVTKHITIFAGMHARKLSTAVVGYKQRGRGRERERERGGRRVRVRVP